jgi:hypothetical protein
MKTRIARKRTDPVAPLWLSKPCASGAHRRRALRAQQSARCGDAPTSPRGASQALRSCFPEGVVPLRGKQWPRPKSLAAGLLGIFGRALTELEFQVWLGRLGMVGEALRGVRAELSPGGFTAPPEQGCSNCFARPGKDISSAECGRQCRFPPGFRFSMRRKGADMLGRALDGLGALPRMPLRVCFGQSRLGPKRSVNNSHEKIIYNTENNFVTWVAFCKPHPAFHPRLPV